MGTCGPLSIAGECFPFWCMNLEAAVKQILCGKSSILQTYTVVHCSTVSCHATAGVHVRIWLGLLFGDGQPIAESKSSPSYADNLLKK